LSNEKANQSCFAEFLFHTKKVSVGIGFTQEKNLFFTGFAHHKVILWKSCGLDLSCSFERLLRKQPVFVV